MYKKVSTDLNFVEREKAVQQFWKDEKIFRGQLCNLANIMRENKLTLTTMIVVGEAIDNRAGLSKLYSGHFTHMFRKGDDN